MISLSYLIYLNAATQLCLSLKILLNLLDDKLKAELHSRTKIYIRYDRFIIVSSEIDLNMININSF